MGTSTARHLYIATIVICLLVAIEIAVYFTISVGVERDVTFSIMKDLGRAFKPIGESLSTSATQDVCAALKSASAAPAAGNSRIRGVAIGVALIAVLCAGLLTRSLWTSTTLTTQDKTRVLVEVGCVALGFLCFDLFFFRVIVKGNEPVTASGMLVDVGKKTLAGLSLSELQQEAQCA